MTQREEKIVEPAMKWTQYVWFWVVLCTNRWSCRLRRAHGEWTMDSALRPIYNLSYLTHFYLAVLIISHQMAKCRTVVCFFFWVWDFFFYFLVLVIMSLPNSKPTAPHIGLMEQLQLWVDSSRVLLLSWDPDSKTSTWRDLVPWIGFGYYQDVWHMFSFFIIKGFVRVAAEIGLLICSFTFILGF